MSITSRLKKLSFAIRVTAGLIVIGVKGQIVNVALPLRHSQHNDSRIMEFIFELFAEMLATDDTQQPQAITPAPQTDDAIVEEQATDIQPVNIFNVVNFH